LTTPEDFFGGAWKGDGRVCGITGKVLRRFEVVFEGAWSEPHRAFHTDETVTYADGRKLSRHWVVHTDETGAMSGADNLAGRMRVTTRGAGFRIVYDRPQGISRTPAVSSIVLEFQPSGTRLSGLGVTRVLGLPVRRTVLQLERVR
jgi:hypothetical protein